MAASSPIGAIPALIAMTAVVLSVTVTAVLAVYADHPNRWTITAAVVAAIGLWSALLALPALLRRLR